MVSKRKMSLACAATTAIVAALAAVPASAGDKPIVSYYLPKADVSVTLTHTLVSCPAKNAVGDDRKPVIKSKWTVKSEAQADKHALVNVDVSSGFLTKRSNAFTFYPNGTLSGFNGSSEGQGGTVIASSAKLAGLLGPMLGQPGAGGVSVDGYYCNASVLAALDGVEKTEKAIGELEDKIARGEAGQAQISILATLKDRLAAFRKKLVLKDDAKPQGTADPYANGIWQGDVRAMGMLEKWFTNVSPANSTDAASFSDSAFEQDRVYVVQIVPSNGNSVAKDAGLASLRIPTRDLVYRWPVAAKVQTKDKFCNDGDECWKDVEVDEPIVIPQWGTISRLPVGSGGIFGSRQAAAKFSAFGQPTELSYGTDSGGAGIGATIDAASGLVTTLRDSKTTELERKIKRLELEKKLEDLEAGESGGETE